MSPTPACDGDWWLGSTFYTCSDCGLGQTCEPTGHPKNCADGSFIKFPDGSCFCIAACASFRDMKVGDVCDREGKWHCRVIRATNAGANGGTRCVPDAWNLCEEGGASPQPAPQPTPEPNPDSGAGSNPGEPDCEPEGASCSDDDDCCSKICSFGTCW